MNNLQYQDSRTSTLPLLGAIAIQALADGNSKRVANAFGEALEILRRQAKSVQIAQKMAKSELGISLADAHEEFYLACLNTAQYERALQELDALEAVRFITPKDHEVDRAELLTRSGQQHVAENLLQERLSKNMRDVATYIALGDIYYVWQLQDERQDHKRAEFWYYQAYDLGLANIVPGTKHKTDNEDAEMLLERLGSVCIDRLRMYAQEKLLCLLARRHIGDWPTIYQLREQVYRTGYDSVLLNHLQNQIANPNENISQQNQDLQVLTNYYNLLPQKSLDDLSPFEMRAHLPPGEHTCRIKQQMLEEYMADQAANTDQEQLAGAEFSSAFSAFQDHFLKQDDPVTGHRRNKLIEREHKKAVRDFEYGKSHWLGFLRYRDSDELDQGE
ncbi:MAG: hypothetical protein V1895_01500 [Parcubacteria group bacterium]